MFYEEYRKGVRLLLTAIPIMTSNTTPTGIASASSVYGTQYPAWRAFNDNVSDSWISQYTSGTVQTNQWIRYDFVTPKNIIKYSIDALFGTATPQWQVGTAPKSWRFEASNNGIDWVVLDTKTNFSQDLWVSSSGHQEFLISNAGSYLMYRLFLVSYQYSGATYFQINELKMYESEKPSLIFNNGMYKSYKDGNFIDVTSGNPTEDDYLVRGIKDITIIPEATWMTLIGEVELCCFSENPTTTEMVFSIETEPFTLEKEWESKDIEVLYYTDDPAAAESVVTVETDPFTLAKEWQDKQIKIIEYTDNPSQIESTITIDTEPFNLYDELGDSVDVLYYTDDSSKTSAELNFTANYSPLDEIEGDFDVVTWSDNGNPKTLDMKAIPTPQLIRQTEDYQMYGDLLSIVDKLNSENGILRYAFSFNEGVTWEVCKFGVWKNIDISNLTNFIQNGMSHFDISRIESVTLTNKGDKIRFAYYIEDNIHNSDSGIEIDKVQLEVDAATDSTKFENLAFYVLNTNATIQLSVSGNKILGVLDDSDRGKVQYRIFLNNRPYYPADGNFTPLAPAPQDIDIKISERDILFNQENIVKVEFQDYWGETDYWQTSFIGSYSGLMFMDETGEYLSDTFGGILKYLQFGDIYAGQTTIDQKVVIKNQLGYPVDEMLLTVNKEVLPAGVGIELSRQQAPFLATDYITYGLTKEDETQEFYVRITSDIDAEPVSNGIFELRVNAKKT